jgi:hypothetical protein
VPAGGRSWNGGCFGIGLNAGMWSASDATSAGRAIVQSIQDSGSGISAFERNYPTGYSVRCSFAMRMTESC